MHEMSIALEVCNIAEQHVGRDRLAHVVTVGLEVGDDSGVECDSLEFCLEAVLSSPPFHRARAVVDRVSGDVLRVSYLEVDDGRAND
ncbi:MAG: hydrogenase maturation nickel metallochaperone HypA [Gemmatimonadota bacterium]|nr:MAG: hydrogenase maturation nickel metallochaperone HypA [Gemmatimonadota bacterium]